MRVLITGGTGFIGSHLARRLAEGGDHVVTTSRSPAVGLPSEHAICDVRSPDARSLAAGADAIVHLAGLSDASSSLAAPLAYSETNALGTLNILEGARAGGGLFVLASSQLIYRPSPDPLSEDDPIEPGEPYGYSKVVAERWTEMYQRLYGVATVVLRFFSVYGPGQLVQRGASGVISIFAQRALAGEEIRVHSDHHRRDFVNVRDVVDAVELAMRRPGAVGNAYNVGSGRPTTILELAELVRAVVGSSSPIAVLGHDLGRSPIADITRARADLGYTPSVPLDEGVRAYVDWLRTPGQRAAERPADRAATGR
ncbi:MAG: NAD-dependent epimerase/dehydratase family protein [Chloroflexi bacterium]|nr:NAD-dependent epimerase/dehydratase family protein [Chloroflexota bacterium]